MCRSGNFKRPWYALYLNRTFRKEILIMEAHL
jgi:hypothetical protein